MAFANSTTPKNRITRSVKPGSLFEDARNVISTSTDINQGDLCFYDGSSDTIKTITAEADCVTFVGIMDETLVDGVPLQPYTTATSGSVALGSVKGPKYGVIANMKLYTGDSFVSGDPVYAAPSDADAQTVSSSGTKAIGIYQGADVTATSDSTGEVYFGHRYPGDVLAGL